MRFRRRSPQSLLRFLIAGGRCWTVSAASSVPAMRRRVAWGVALPLALAGTQAAHALAYVLVYPQASLRGAALAAAGHSYLTWLPAVLAGAGACALLSLGGAVVSAARGRTGHAAPAWGPALLAPTVFCLQETLELSLHTGTFGWRAVLAPTFLPGLALQLPFALAAYLVARALLRAPRGLGLAFARPPVALGSPVFSLHARPSFVRTLLCSVAPRGPPRVVGI